MHHPGPPRFVAVGDSVELAPREPDPDAAYHWRVADAPADSGAALGDDPVEWFTPDVPGVYRVELDAPDGVHTLTVRAFPADIAVRVAGGSSGMSGASGMSGSGPQFSGSAHGSGSAVAGSGDGTGGRPRVRLDGGRDGDDVVLHATATPHPDAPADESLAVEFYVDDRDSASLTVTGTDARLAVPDAPVRVHAVAVGEQGYSVADAVRVHPDGSVERLYEPPQWATHTTLYEVYVRAFTDADDGDFFGAMEDRLDYLADLGVETLWLTPVLQNDLAPHGYNIVDFYSIASDLGTREAYEQFIEAAHDRGMKVLFDLVLNHSAREHPFFKDAYQNPESDYYDWYEWQESGEPGTYFDWEYIANFDFDNLRVREHLFEAVEQWADLVDGFRCDMAWAVPRPVWTELRDRVKASQGSDFLLLDETIPYIADFHEGMFDMHFDTTLYFTLRQVGWGEADADAVLDAYEQRARVGFPDHAAFMLYLENHDETRYLEECGRPEVLAASAAQFTLPGVPMLYGGQEIGMREKRGPVRWEDADEALYDHYRALIETRKAIPALQYEGAFERIDYEADSGRVTAFAREHAGERYVVVLNFGAEAATVSFPGESVATHDEVSGESVAGVGGDLTVESVAVVRADA